MNFILLFIFKLMLLLYGGIVESEQNMEQIMFVWDSELVSDQVLEILKEDGFDTLYIYLSLSNQKTYGPIVELCQTYGMSVYALNGSYEWLDKPDLQDDFFDLVERIDDKRYTNFKGVVLDIEPYVLDTKNEEKAYEDFMALIRKAKVQTVDLGLQLNTVIPFWYEKIQVPSMNTSENLAIWVIDNSDEVSIMAYRNEIEGSNGIVHLIDEEIHYSLSTDTKVIVTLETRPSSEGEHISFDRLGKESVFDVIENLKKQVLFKWLNILYGVHDLESWLELEN